MGCTPLSSSLSHSSSLSAHRSLVLVFFCQTKDNTNPRVVLMDAIRDLKNELKDLDTAFEAAISTYKDKTNAGAMDY